MTDVSIIIPCWQSEADVERRVRDVESIMSATRWSWEVLLCDDGSTDGTPGICRRLVEEEPSRRRFRASAVNRGRGRNVAEGVPETTGRFVGYIDADSSTSPAYLVPVLRALEEGAEVAEAHRFYKIKPKEFPFIAHRLAAHIVYRRLVQIMLGLRGHDTESGFKFFRRGVLEKLMEQTRAPGWFWDTEIIANAHRMGLFVADIPSLFVRTPHMASTVKLARDSWVQWRSLREYARSLGNRSLRGACCVSPAASAPRPALPSGGPRKP